MGDHAGADMMIRVLVCTLVWFSIACSKGKSNMTEKSNPSQAVDAILTKVRESYIFQHAEVEAYQEDPRIYSALLERMKAMDNEGKARCLSRFDDLGAAVVRISDKKKPYLAPYMADKILIEALVGYLGHADGDIREAAVRQIFDNVPDLYLRNHVNETIANIVAYPQTGRAAQILAKTGSEKARSIIRSNAGIRSQDELWTVQALAKLGDSTQEDRLINDYYKEKEVASKRDLAWMLGFVATPRTILALARDLRNPMTYEWNQTAPRSFRVHIIEGLSRAYPMEPLLWMPNGTPYDDSYYQRIEDWAESKLGVTWTVPRPPFLYQMDVPVPASNP